MNELATQDKKQKLTPKQIEVLALIVSGHTYEGASAASGVAVATINAWMKKSAFNEEYRLGMERFRNIFESRMMALAQKASTKISQFMDSANPEVSLEASKITINAAVRLNNRYKELQVQGFIAPVQPLVIFPEGTKLPWAVKDALPMLPAIPEVIDAEATDVESDEDDE